MKLRWTLRDGKKVLQQEIPNVGEVNGVRFKGMEWQDVPDAEIPKEPEFIVEQVNAPWGIRLIDERLVNQFVIICEGIIEYYEHDGKKPHPYNWAKNVLDTYRKHVPKERT